MVCAAWLTVRVRCTCGAAVKFALPAWLASMMKVPAVVTVRVLPDMVPVPVPPAMEKTTGLPDAPPVATSEIVRPEVYVAAAGCVKLMVCAA